MKSLRVEVIQSAGLLNLLAKCGQIWPSNSVNLDSKSKGGIVDSKSKGGIVEISYPVLLNSSF